MGSQILYRYFAIVKHNLRHNFLPHLFLAVLFLLITPVVFGISNLDATAAVMPLELFTVLIGILLLPPVFLPEQSLQVRETIESKYTRHLTVCLIRFVYSMLALILLLSLLAFDMRICNSAVSLQLVAGTIITAFFLGSLGLFSFGLSDSVAVGFMVPVIYYAFNFAGKEMLGNFYLFSMTQNSFHEKYWLLAGGCILVLITFLYRELKIRTR